YELFLKRVAEGRGKPIEMIAASAEGRIFSGADAKERGLCDELGGLDDAIRAALELAKLPEDTPIDLVAEHGALFDIFEGATGDDAEAKLGEAAAPLKAALAPDVTRWVPEVGTFLRSWQPALMGERAIVALPYVALLR